MAKTVFLRISGEEHRIEITDGRFVVDGIETLPPRHAYAVADGNRRWVFLHGEVYEFEVGQQRKHRAYSVQNRPHGAGRPGSLAAPMPATVVRIDTAAGAVVKRGQTLLVLEAMKMELPIRATSDGTVSVVNCRVGDLVQPGVSLIEIA
jgi:biotin carboxyl carrier protein